MIEASNSIKTLDARIKRLSFLKWLVRISRFGLAALFLFTAGAKLATAKAFAKNVSELLSASGFNYERWMWPTTLAVITAEIITAVLLLVSRTVRIGAYSSSRDTPKPEAKRFTKLKYAMIVAAS